MQRQAKTKRKRGKAPRGDGPSPKRPAGAYLLFLQDFRRGFLQARPDVTVTAREVASAAGAAWRAIDPQLKGEYEARSAAEKAKYACAKMEYAAAVPAGGAAPRPSDGVPSCPAEPKVAAAHRNAASAHPILQHLERAAGPAGAGTREAEEEAQHGARTSEEEAVVPGTCLAQPHTPAAEHAADEAEPPAGKAEALPGRSTVQPPVIRQSPSPLPAREHASRSNSGAGAAAAVVEQAGAERLKVAARQQSAPQAVQQAGGPPAEPGGPSGFSLFVQETRSAYEVMFWCGPASLPEAVLAAAQVWQSLAGWNRLEFASRQAQVQASNPALGMHTLIPDLEQKVVHMAAAAAMRDPAADAAGGPTHAQPEQLLEQLLASDVGPPPVLPSLATVPPALQRAAEAAAQMACAKEMRAAPPEGQALMVATAQAVVGAAAHAAVGVRIPDVAPTAGVGPAQPGWPAALPLASGAHHGWPALDLPPSAIGSPCSSAFYSVLGLLPFG